MKYLVAVVLMLAAGTVSAAVAVRDTLSVHGQVVDSLSGTPLGDAMVKLRQRTGGGGGGITVILDSMLTDASGLFDFGSFLPAGQISVWADKDEYLPDVVTIPSDTGGVIAVKLALFPDSTDIALPVLITVADGYSTRPTVSWHPVDGAVSYMVQMDTLQHFSSPMIAVPTSDTSYTSLIDLPVGTVYWRVSSSLNLALFTPRSSFEILDPSIPLLIPYSPDSTADARPTLVWHAVSGASTYTIQIDDAADFASPIFSVPTADTSYAPLADLPAGAVYWRVKSDLNATYSAADMFYVLDRTIPQLIAYEPDPTTETRPTLRWHPVAGAASYRIQIDNQASFMRVDIDTTVGDTVFTPAGDLNEGNVYWRVMAGNGTVFSAVDNFYILSDQVPLLITFDGDTVETYRPVFRWHPVDSATSYTIEVGTDQTFAAKLLSTPTADTFYTPLVNLPAGIVYWRVSCSLDPARFSPNDRVFITAPLGITGPDAGRPAAAGRVSPNPFAAEVTMEVQLSERSGAVFTVATAGGQVLCSQSCMQQGPGSVAFTWNANGMSAGTYVLAVTSGTEMYLRRVTLAR